MPYPRGGPAVCPEPPIPPEEADRAPRQLDQVEGALEMLRAEQMRLSAAVYCLTAAAAAAAARLHSCRMCCQKNRNHKKIKRNKEKATTNNDP